MSKNNVWKKVGSLRKSDKGALYLKFDEDVQLKKGDALMLKDPRKSLDSAVEAGRMKEEMAEEMKAKIPAWIKYEVILAPPRD